MAKEQAQKTCKQCGREQNATRKTCVTKGCPEKWTIADAKPSGRLKKDDAIAVLHVVKEWQDDPTVTENLVKQAKNDKEARKAILDDEDLSSDEKVDEIRKIEEGVPDKFNGMSASMCNTVLEEAKKILG